ncbi:hypothetical protein [Candidatus Magnetominusculus xianensis]|uniref:Transposase n=1 Tax=Candidatus Magnetominusculus xianensis TaxID=1748249 RepID=A0ABR5SB81_9BACT|nr:hypothetical protein [Candidatus Magnetominusculus xianensis]KWT76399.1 transposase [Candidatus Magnetominusculus xianensis]MBF0404867.1 hypothetical protein [Nitrospirota bacterium]
MSALHEENGENGLLEISGKKPNFNNKEIERAVIEFVIENPAYGQLRASNELKKKYRLVTVEAKLDGTRIAPI